jgi:hypothetical protein
VEPTRTFARAPTHIDPQDRDAVLWLQLALARLMPGPAAMVHIGQLGPMTEKALRLYQLGHKLPLTGKPDAATLQHIRAQLGERKLEP